MRIKRVPSSMRRLATNGHVLSTAAFVTDQAVCSGGNFLTSFLAARNLAPAQFGTFALLNILFVFSLTVNNWLLRSTLSGVLELSDSEAVRRFVGTLVGLSGLFGLIPAAVLVGAALVLHHAELCLPLVLIAVAGQVQETLRRTAMVRSTYRVGLLGDAISYLGQACLIAVAVYRHSLTLTLLFWLMGLTSCASFLVQAQGLGMARPARLKETALRCWSNGRWIVLSGIVLSPIVYGMPWLVEMTRGQVEAGRLSGLLLVLGIANPVVFSSTWLLLAKGQKARNASLGALIRQTLPTVGLSSIPLIIFWLTLAIAPQQTLRLFYGKHSAYLEMGSALQLVVCYFAVSYLAVCLEIITDLRERSRDRVRIDIWITVLMFAAGIPLSWKVGLSGIVLVGIAVQSIRAASYVMLLRKPATSITSSKFKAQVKDEPVGETS